MNERFTTLLRREWMQHQTGWLLVIGVPLALLLGVAVFGRTVVELDHNEMPDAPLAMVFATVAASAALAMMLSWLAALLQAPGLARRDAQDRSIEFWSSLPLSHWQSLGATLLAHLLLVPWLALASGMTVGLLVSVIVAGKTFGLGAWLALPWATIVPAVLAVVLRLGVGLLLATLWMSPLILGLMAASAWLKRWGVPAVVLTLVLGALVLDKLYGITIVGDTLAALVHHASQALVGADRAETARQLQFDGNVDLAGALGRVPGWALSDFGVALRDLATPAFAAAVAAGATAFGLIWFQRARGG